MALEITDREVCAFDTAAVLYLTLELTVTNLRDRPVILGNTAPTDIGSFIVRPALPEGGMGKQVFSLDAGDPGVSLEELKHLPQLRVFDEPDTKYFSVVPPGMSHRKIIKELTLEVRGAYPTTSSILLTPGRDYFLSVHVYLWPFRATPDYMFQYARKAWASYGDLIQGAPESNYARFKVPEFMFEDLKPCRARR
jgi:hypothetical protein